MDDELVLPEPVEAPNFTQVPNLFLDWAMARLSGAEWKVLSYLVRRTWGVFPYDIFQPISQNDIVAGTRCARSVVAQSLKDFEARGFIEVERRTTKEHGKEASLYRLRVHKPPRPMSSERTSIAAESSPTMSAERATPAPVSGHRSIQRSYKDQKIPTSINPDKYFTGPHAACRICGTYPCTCEIAP